MLACRKELIQLLKAEGQANCFDNKTVAAEGEGKFVIINKGKPRKTICRVHIDDCLIKGTTTKRCDYLFKVCETKRYILIEFKGSDVKSAFPQLISTFQYLKKKLTAKPDRFEGIIVASRYVPAADQKIRRLREDRLKKYKLRITVKNKEYRLKI